MPGDWLGDDDWLAALRYRRLGAMLEEADFLAANPPPKRPRPYRPKSERRYSRRGRPVKGEAD